MLVFSFDSYYKTTTAFTINGGRECLVFSYKFKMQSIKNKNLRSNSLKYAFLIFKSQLTTALLQGCFRHQMTCQRERGSMCGTAHKMSMNK